MGVSCALRASTIILVDPNVQRLHQFMDQLETEYMELKKKMEQLAVGSAAKIPAILPDVEKTRKFIKKTIEVIDNSK